LTLEIKDRSITELSLDNFIPDLLGVVPVSISEEFFESYGAEQIRIEGNGGVKLNSSIASQMNDKGLVDTSPNKPPVLVYTGDKKGKVYIIIGNDEDIPDMFPSMIRHEAKKEHVRLAGGPDTEIWYHPKKEKGVSVSLDIIDKVNVSRPSREPWGCEWIHPIDDGSSVVRVKETTIWNGKGKSRKNETLVFVSPKQVIKFVGGKVIGFRVA
jgi:hypothetical protein